MDCTYPRAEGLEVVYGAIYSGFSENTHTHTHTHTHTNTEFSAQVRYFCCSLSFFVLFSLEFSFELSSRAIKNHSVPLESCVPDCGLNWLLLISIFTATQDALRGVVRRYKFRRHSKYVYLIKQNNAKPDITKTRLFKYIEHFTTKN